MKWISTVSVQEELQTEKWGRNSSLGRYFQNFSQALVCKKKKKIAELKRERELRAKKSFIFYLSHVLLFLSHVCLKNGECWDLKVWADKVMSRQYGKTPFCFIWFSGFHDVGPQTPLMTPAYTRDMKFPFFFSLREWCAVGRGSPYGVTSCSKAGPGISGWLHMFLEGQIWIGPQPF